jgi:hypothetical protein
VLEDDLGRLVRRDNAALDQLTSDLWRRDADRMAAAQSARRLAAWQGVVLAVAVISSAAFGLVVAGAARPRPGILFAAGDLAPGTLILGVRQ